MQVSEVSKLGIDGVNVNSTWMLVVYIMEDKTTNMENGSADDRSYEVRDYNT